MSVDFKRVWDAYYPVIAAARELRAHYNGENKHGTPLVMPDPAGKLMTALRAAELQYNIIIKVEETNNGSNENENENEKKDETKETSSD